MKSKTPGIVLIMLGILMLIYSGFNYVTTEKVIDLGPVKINREKKNSVKWPQVAGSVVLIAGIIITVITKRK